MIVIILYKYKNFKESLILYKKYFWKIYLRTRAPRRKAVTLVRCLLNLFVACISSIPILALLFWSFSMFVRKWWDYSWWEDQKQSDGRRNTIQSVVKFWFNDFWLWLLFDLIQIPNVNANVSGFFCLFSKRQKCIMH